MLKYRCENCGSLIEQSELPPRCPSCLRQSAFIIEKKKKVLTKHKKWGAISAIIMIPLGAFIYWQFFATQQIRNQKETASILRTSDLMDLLESEQLHPKKEYLSFFHSEGVEKWIQKQQFSSATHPDQIVSSFKQDLLSNLSPDKNLVTLPHQSNDVFFEEAKLRNLENLVSPNEKEENKPSASYLSLELTMALTSILRELDHHAFVAQIIGTSRRKYPYDPSGKLGYFIVGILKNESETQIWQWIDILEQSIKPIQKPEVRILGDTETLAALLNHKAALEQIQNANTSEAFKLSEVSLRLDPRSAPSRSNHAWILAASGALQEAIKESQAAIQIQPNSSLLHAHGSLLFTSGEIEGAHQKTVQALEQHPEFSQAHVTLATILLLKGDAAKAKTHLELAKRYARAEKDPRSYVIWANYYLSQNNLKAAEEKAKQLINDYPKSWKAHLQALPIFKAVNNLDLAKLCAKKLIALAPESQKSQLNQLIKQSFGEGFLNKEPEKQQKAQLPLPTNPSPNSNFGLKTPSFLQDAKGTNDFNPIKPQFHLLAPNEKRLE